MPMYFNTSSNQNGIFRHARHDFLVAFYSNYVSILHTVFEVERNFSYFTHIWNSRWDIYTHPFNDPLSGTTRMSRYQEGKTNLDFRPTAARDSEWQWHQLGRMQVCTSLQTDNRASTPSLTFYRPDALPAAQPTASKH